MTSSTAASNGISVLFVCLGNICRSPMAEAVFQDTLQTLSSSSHLHITKIDSCGTGAYHAQAPPDPRTMSVLKKNGITSYSHSARKIRTSDFDDFDYLFAMDADNLEDMQDMRRSIVRKRKSDDGVGQVMLFGRFAGSGQKGEQVVDPYYGHNNGFDIAFEQMRRFSKGFIDFLQQESVQTE